MPLVLVSVNEVLFIISIEAIKVAQEGHDQIFTFSFWCIFGANNFFLPNFQERELGLCLTSSQTFGHVTPCMTVFEKFENLSEIYNFHTIVLHFALLDINNLFTTLD